MDLWEKSHSDIPNGTASDMLLTTYRLILFGTSRVESEGFGFRFNKHILKTCGFEPGAERARIHRNQRVVDMKEAHTEALPAIQAGEHAAGL